MKTKIEIKRLEHNLSKKELAKIAGVSKQTVSEWTLHGRVPRIETLSKLASYFDTTIDDLLE